MPRHGDGPLCAWKDGCKMPVSRRGLWCHRHVKLVSKDELRALMRKHAQDDAILFEAKYTKSRFAEAALQHGLDSPETRAAYDAMVVANGPNAPVPDSWGKL